MSSLSLHSHVPWIAEYVKSSETYLSVCEESKLTSSTRIEIPRGIIASATAREGADDAPTLRCEAGRDADKRTSPTLSEAVSFALTT